MAGIRVQSGVMVFDGDKTSSSRQRGDTDKKPLQVLVVGDFAGAAPRTQPLLQRKHLRVDTDTFDEVFSRLGVAVKLPFDEEPVRFSCLQDMHPDHLYDNISLFNRYRSLKKQLKSPAHFSQAVAMLSGEGLIETPVTPNDAAPVQVNLLDSVLSGSTYNNTGGFADQLIRQTIAPYLEPKQHPKVPEYIEAVDLAMAQVMRKIMHADAFQKLEATWRGLDLLQRRVDLDRSCHLHLLDAPIAEILASFAFAEGDLRASALCQNLAQHTAGKKPYDVIILDELLLADAHINERLTVLNALAECAGALIFAGGDSGFADTMSDADGEYWQQLRKSSAADRFFIACPRVLLRLPYGKRTAVIDSFAFEELPQPGAHDYYLWGNGAYLLLLALAQAEGATLGACYLDNLPLHVYRDEDGDEALKPCAEIYLPEDKVAALEEVGFTVLQSMQNSNSVMVQRWRSMDR
ncbi:MAG TPA: type VI secretion system contractile sheath large subunit [Cellvibrio sp.]|nr:type VI secretion system contractile sheath large subunit [Cellvibrio sp.]